MVQYKPHAMQRYSSWLWMNKTCLCTNAKPFVTFLQGRTWKKSVGAHPCSFWFLRSLLWTTGWVTWNCESLGIVLINSHTHINTQSGMVKMSYTKTSQIKSLSRTVFLQVLWTEGETAESVLAQLAESCMQEAPWEHQVIEKGITVNTIMILFFVISPCCLEKDQFFSSAPQRFFPKNIQSRLTKRFWKRFWLHVKKQWEFKKGREKTEYLN